MTTRAERKKLHGSGQEYWRRLGSDIKRDKYLYLLLLPGLIYFIVFKYLPMFGIVIAFENYVPYSGVLGSEWVGLKWFNYFFRFPAWVTYLKNTLILSLMNIVFYFPAPSSWRCCSTRCAPSATRSSCRPSCTCRTSSPSSPWSPSPS